MSRVKGRNTKPEIAVRKIAHALGFRFRLHRGDLPGRPDMVFPGRGAVVFVHGCFWHQHPGCWKATVPATRTDFWQAKLDRNVERDVNAVRTLEAAGWKVLTVWECQTRDVAALREVLREFMPEAPTSRRLSHR